MDQADEIAQADQRVFFFGIDWTGYEVLLAVRGERQFPKMTYLEGTLELMTPSTTHEGLKKAIARLLEAYADAKGLELNGYGSWTLRRSSAERGLEPDECYVLGCPTAPERPDLAIEIVWTPGGIDKLEVYRGLGVPEVWQWLRGRIEIYVLRDGRYQRVERSGLLPDLDIDLLESLLTRPSQAQAVRELREVLRKKG